MRVDSSAKDLQSMKDFAKRQKPSSVEFACTNCKRIVVIENWRRFLARTHLLCRSCKMKIVNNVEQDKNRRRASRVKANRKARASKEREDWLVVNEFAPKNVEIESIFIDSNGEKNYNLRCLHCGNIFIWNEYQRNENVGISQHPFCKKCFHSPQSKKETELYEYVRSIYSGKILRNCRRVISPKEIDIFLPDLKLGFEFDGVHFHSGPSYCLLEKTLLCEKKGIRLVHVIEYDWHESRIEKTKSIVRDILLGKSVVDRTSFVEDNILYVDKLFSESIDSKLFLGSTNPRKHFFKFSEEVGYSDEYIYDCGYDCYSVDGKLHAVRSFKDDSKPLSKKASRVCSIEEIDKNDASQRVSFSCIVCKKEVSCYARTVLAYGKLVCQGCKKRAVFKAKKAALR